jgi:hypothetical protein
VEYPQTQLDPTLHSPECGHQLLATTDQLGGEVGLGLKLGTEAQGEDRTARHHCLCHALMRHHERRRCVS